MFRIIGLSGVGFALAVMVALAGASMSASPADAVIYCKTVGVPRGCVVRPAARPVVVEPVVVEPAARPVVYCKTRGVPKGCVVR